MFDKNDILFTQTINTFVLNNLLNSKFIGIFNINYTKNEILTNYNKNKGDYPLYVFKKKL